MDFFRLLSRSIRRPPAPELRHRLALDVDLPTAAADPREENEDELAADHESLFGFNVPPFASVFLEENGMLGGVVTARAASFRAEAGLPPATSEPADHASSELELLSILHRDGSGGTAASILLSRFLDQHFYAWYPAFAHAVAAEGNALYTSAVCHVLDCLTPENETVSGNDGPIPAGLPKTDDIMGRPETGVADIADFLATPVRCGIFLSRSAIGRLGRSGRYPTGFGDRSRMLATLLRSAALYDGLDDVADGIECEIAETRTAWEALARQGSEAAGFWASEWIGRLDGTQAMLGKIMVAVRGTGSQEG